MDETDLNISHVARKTGLTPHTLRYYERIGLIPSLKRASNGHRRYRARDMEWIAFLKRLRDMGVPIRDMKRYAELRAEGPGTARARREMLQQHHAKITEHIATLGASLELLDEKIATYREMEAEHENKRIVP